MQQVLFCCFFVCALLLLWVLFCLFLVKAKYLPFSIPCSLKKQCFTRRCAGTLKVQRQAGTDLELYCASDRTKSVLLSAGSATGEELCKGNGFHFKERPEWITSNKYFKFY